MEGYALTIKPRKHLYCPVCPTETGGYLKILENPYSRYQYIELGVAE